jgi:hypothetical protein
VILDIEQRRNGVMQVEQNVSKFGGVNTSANPQCRVVAIFVLDE